MSAKEAFGPNLRRARLKRGVTLEQIARETRIGLEHLQALEENDFRHWPSGIYARAWIRTYAQAVGVEPEATVDEFCRWFPQGDRRAARTLEETAGIIGHELALDDPIAGTEQDRRSLSQPATVGAGLLVLRWLARVASSRRVTSRGARQEVG